MDRQHQPRQTSPQWTPRPLKPSPWNTPQVSPLETTPLDQIPDTPQLPPLYLSTVARPMQDPNDIIHEFYNVAPVPFQFERDGSIPRTIEMPLLRRSEYRPTHALAFISNIGHPSGSSGNLSVLSEPSSSTHPPPSPLSPLSPYSPVNADPLILPIDASLFCMKFGHDVARSLAAGLSIRAATPLIRRDRATGAQMITLPLIPMYVPHPPSIPHILLYGQNLPIEHSPPHDPPNYSRPTTPRSTSSATGPRASPSTLATYLLPIPAIEEFPSAPAMAEVMARHCAEESLRDHVVFNQGLWRNVLLLAPTDLTLVDLARVAWNVTTEARKIRDRHRAAATLLTPPMLRSPRIGHGDLPAVNVQYAEAAKTWDRSDTIHLLPVPPNRKPSHRRSHRNLRA